MGSRQGQRIGALAALALALACQQQSAPASLDDTPENRTAQIGRYFQAMPPENLLKDIVDKMSSRMPDDQRTIFVDMMTKHIDMAKLETAMREAMGKHFTADELRALADFYGSPLGKSAMGKFGNYMADVMPTIQGEVIAAMGKVRSEMEAKAAAPAPPAGEQPAPAAADAPAEPPKKE